MDLPASAPTPAPSHLSNGSPGTISSQAAAHDPRLATQVWAATCLYVHDWAQGRPTCTIILTSLLVLVIVTSRIFWLVLVVAVGLIVGFTLAQDTDTNWAADTTDTSETSSPPTRRAQLLAAFHRLVSQRIADATAMTSLQSEHILHTSASIKRRHRTSSHARPTVALPPSVQAAWSNLVDLILRDFIDYWYDPLEGSKSGDFRRLVRQALTTVSLNLYDYTRQDHVNLAVLIFYAMANTLIVNLREYRQLELSGKSVTQYLHDNPASLFHHLADHDAQVAHLMELAKFLLTRLLPTHDRESPLVFALLTEIVATSLLEPMIASLCDPDYINLLIVATFSDSPLVSTVDPTIPTDAPITKSGGETAVNHDTPVRGLWQKLGFGVGPDGPQPTLMVVELTITIATCSLTLDSVYSHQPMYFKFTCTGDATAAQLPVAASTTRFNESVHDWVHLTMPESWVKMDGQVLCQLYLAESMPEPVALGSATLCLAHVVAGQYGEPRPVALQDSQGCAMGTIIMALELGQPFEQPNSTDDSLGIPDGYAPLRPSTTLLNDDHHGSPTGYDLLPASLLDLESPADISGPGLTPQPSTASKTTTAAACPPDIDLSELFPLRLDRILAQDDAFVEFMQYLEDQGLPPYLRLVMNVDSYRRFATTLNDPDLMRDDAWSIFHLHFFDLYGAAAPPGSSDAASPPYPIPMDPPNIRALATTIHNNPSPNCFQSVMVKVQDRLRPHFAQFKQTSPLYQLWLKEKWVRFARQCCKEGQDPVAKARERLARHANDPPALSTKPVTAAQQPPNEDATEPTPTTHTTSPASSPADAGPPRPGTSRDTLATDVDPGSSSGMPPDQSSLVSPPPQPSQSPPEGELTAGSSGTGTSALDTHSITSEPELRRKLSTDSTHTLVTNADDRLVFVASTMAQLKERISIIDNQLEDTISGRQPKNRTKERQLKQTRAELARDLGQLQLMVEDLNQADPESTALASPSGASTLDLARPSSDASSVVVDGLESSDPHQLLTLTNVTVHVQEATSTTAPKGPARMAAQLMTSLSTRDSALIFVVEAERAADPTQGISHHGWLITRSYADFASLHASLKQHVAKVDKIKFPSRQWTPTTVPSVTSPKHPKQTPLAGALQHYLSMLLSDRLISASRPMQLFMKPDHMTIPKSFFSTKPASVFGTARASGVGVSEPNSTWNPLAMRGFKLSLPTAGSAAGPSLGESPTSHDVFSPRFLTQPATQAAAMTSRTVGAAFKSASSALKRLTAESGTFDAMASPTTEPSAPAGDNAVDSMDCMMTLPAPPKAQRSVSANHIPLSKLPAPTGVKRLSGKSLTMTSDRTSIASTEASQPPSLCEPGSPAPQSPVEAPTHGTSTPNHSTGHPATGLPIAPPAPQSCMQSNNAAEPVAPQRTSSHGRPADKKELSSEEIELLIETFFALLDEVFDLSDRKQWLRRKALTVLKQLLRQSYTSTVSSMFVETVAKHTKPTTVAAHMERLTESFWPNGIWYSTNPAGSPDEPTTATSELRSQEQKAATQLEARVLFVSHMPDALQRMVGEYNGVLGMTRLFELLQHPELVRPIAIKLLDSVCKLVLSELH
ncbi:phosphatidylinositol binding [Dimargaris xerosporica]|nr:phosphatidylinositol binding [Dimargaris xerosporica]